MRAVVIINPVAGAGRARTLKGCESLAHQVLSRQGFEAVVQVTAGPADARRLAADALAAGAALVVAWGGDGTINGAGAALAGSGVPLGIVPAGSGNGLARELGLPFDPAAALVVAASGATRAIDGGEIDGELFFNVAGIGLDARIAARLAEPGSRRGLAGYVLATLAELPRYRAIEYAITFDDGRTLVEHALFVALANSRQYGNGAQIAPQARIDDGVLDLVVVRRQSGLRIARQVPAFFRGTLRNGPGLAMQAARSCTISARQAIGFHVDGEPRVGSADVVVRTHPQVLQVRVRH